jgi:hypothetical protein
MATTSNGKKNKAKDDADLAKGADDIKKAEAEKPTKAELEEKRPMLEVVKDRVKTLDGNLGLKIDSDTTLAESLQILDWTTQLSDHVGFFVGDVLNFGHTKFGEKYTMALNITGRAKPTLKNYAWVAKTIAPSKRQSALTFTHHMEIARLGDKTKVEDVLHEVGAQAKKGEAPTTGELRTKVGKMKPKRKPTSGKGKGKGKGKTKPEAPPYEPTADETAQLDVAEEAVAEAASALKSAFKIIAKCDNKEKNRWLDLVEPILLFSNNLYKITGYKK